MPLYNTREPTLLESPGRARGSVPGAVQGLPAACVVASTNRDRALLPPLPPPSSPGLSLYASLYIHIIPIPRDRTTYRCTTDDTSIHVTEHREETGYFDAKDIRVESKRKRNGTAVRYEFGPRRTEATSKERERERGNRSHGETWPRCGLYLKDGRGGSRSYVRTYVRGSTSCP